MILHRILRACPKSRFEEGHGWIKLRDRPYDREVASLPTKHQDPMGVCVRIRRSAIRIEFPGFRLRQADAGTAGEPWLILWLGLGSTLTSGSLASGVYLVIGEDFPSYTSCIKSLSRFIMENPRSAKLACARPICCWTSFFKETLDANDSPSNSSILLTPRVRIICHENQQEMQTLKAISSCESETMQLDERAITNWILWRDGEVRWTLASPSLLSPNRIFSNLVSPNKSFINSRAFRPQRSFYGPGSFGIRNGHKVLLSSMK